MVPHNDAMRCVAVKVPLEDNGEADATLVQFLDWGAGVDQWLMTSEWLFDDGPDEGEHGPTIPVLLPEQAAIRLILTDLDGDRRRVVTDVKVASVQARRWRWAAFQLKPNSAGQGRFPWEDPFENQ